MGSRPIRAFLVGDMLVGGRGIWRCVQGGFHVPLWHWSRSYPVNSSTDPSAAQQTRAEGLTCDALARRKWRLAMKTCPECEGKGIIDEDTDDERQCPNCGGSGFVPDDDSNDEQGVVKT